ncbi:MAG: signal peptidase I [Clostridia bacterium]|nr:signal peptidase I [Clostridia bacterium]
MAKKAEGKNSIGKIIANVLFFLLIAVAAFLITTTTIEKTTGKKILPYSLLRGITESMEPNIPANSYILVKTVSASEIKKGDVITFRSRDPQIQGELNTHRVVAVLNGGTEFVTKGDNNVADDEYHVFSEDILSKYVCNMPVVTFFVNLYSSKAGLIVTLAVGILACVISVFAIRKAVKPDEDDDKEEIIRKRIEEEIARLESENSGRNNADGV